MGATFVVYIDESGDEGFSFDRGSPEWFVLSAVVTRKEEDLETVKLVDTVRKQLGKPDKKPLHFRDLRHEQRLPFIAVIAKAELRAMSVLIHELRQYLELLQEQTAPLDVHIDWSIMGLQIVDAVASSFFYAIRLSAYGFTEDRYVRMLKPVVYQRHGQYLGYGLKFWPREVEDELGAEPFEWIRNTYQ